MSSTYHVPSLGMGSLQIGEFHILVVHAVSDCTILVYKLMRTGTLTKIGQTPLTCNRTNSGAISNISKLSVMSSHQLQRLSHKKCKSLYL
jgi:hypothetical protein